MRDSSGREHGDYYRPPTTTAMEPVVVASQWTTLTSDKLTKRELFAAMAMQGYYGNPNSNGVITDVSFDAVRAADALIAELNKEQTT